MQSNMSILDFPEVCCYLRELFESTYTPDLLAQSDETASVYAIMLVKHLDIDVFKNSDFANAMVHKINFTQILE